MRSDILEYIKKSIDKNEKEAHHPPNEQEILSLFKYLRVKKLDPIIVGSVALIKHLQPSVEDYRDEGFRFTQDIDIFVSSNIPSPPSGWKRDRCSLGVISWISPSGGYIDFLEAGHTYPNGFRNPYHIDKDPESTAYGLPVADIVSVFTMKLNSDRLKDLTDLVSLAQKKGIPSRLLRIKLSPQQKENLESIKLWIENDI